DLFNYEPRHDRIEMGVALVTEMRGKGLSVPVVQRCLAYLREVLHIRSVYCVVSESNTASKQMLLKAGFVQSGVLQDWCRVADGYESAVVYQCLL
ncbi:MAG: GNAT family N-acetyltransferase, partial [Paludibacteraceae bacterium]|nr:GNAT family N-acetyltransferase [Paludibacteraceae bacterium]